MLLYMNKIFCYLILITVILYFCFDSGHLEHMMLEECQPHYPPYDLEGGNAYDNYTGKYFLNEEYNKLPVHKQE